MAGLHPDLDTCVRAYIRNLLLGTALGPMCLADERSGAPGRLLKSDALWRAVDGGRRPSAKLKERRRALREIFAERAGGPVCPVPAPGWLTANLATAAEALALDSTQAQILQLFTVLALHHGFESALTVAFPRVTAREGRSLVAGALGLARPAVARELRRDALLCATGLVTAQIGRRSPSDLYEMNERLLDLLLEEDLRTEDLHETFVPLAREPRLALDDFSHLRGSAETARQLLIRAVAEPVQGVNLLFYGPPGTGKTELAATLAREAAAVLHRVGHADEDGEPPSPWERLRSLQLGNRLLRHRRDAVLLFDEMEDLFDAPRREAQMSKQWFNRMLEGNPVPTIWITNETCAMDPAFLRRFGYVVRFRRPGPTVRRRVWALHTRSCPRVGDAELTRLAAFEATPGQIRSAAEIAALAAGRETVTVDLIETILRPGLELVLGAAPASTGSDVRFRPDLANADADLEDLCARFAERDGATCAASLCLHGPPGTGKSAFATHLARRLGRTLIRRNPSQINSKWVGETEQNLAAAFEQAAEDDAVLLFDEADSFLTTRRGDQRSFEVQAVNEFLLQLERFSGILVCTTNRFEDLDPAAARRFVFKVRFAALRPHQAVKLLHEVLAPFAASRIDTAAEVSVAALDGLTPGDFAAVRRRLAALGATRSPAELVDELRAERAARPGARSRLGFGR